MTPDTLRVFAQLLGMPDKTALAVLSDLAQAYPWLQAAKDELQDISLEQWQGEHNRLFISGYPKTACPPFESFYRHGHLNGPAHMELENLYRKIGLEATDEIPADYLGTLLECAAYLLERKDSEERQWREELWQSHLHLWLPRFSADLQQHSRLCLYRILGERLAELSE